MSGETGEQVSGWTTDTLRAHFSEQIIALDQRMSQRIDDLKVLTSQWQSSSKDALLRAEKIDAYNKEQANEWRRSLDDLRQTFVTKAVGDRIEADTKRVELTLKDTVQRADLHKIEADIEKLRDINSSNSGKTENSGDWLKTLLAVGGLGSAIVFGVLAYSHSTTPTIGIDSKRVDDLVNRFDALSNRMNGLDHPVTKP